MTKLNPLHNPETVLKQMQATGEYFDPERGSGRSTALALNYISRAISSPNLPIRIRDHNTDGGVISIPATKLMNERLMYKISGMLRSLGLKFMLLDFNKQTLTFTIDIPKGCDYKIQSNNPNDDWVDAYSKVFGPSQFVVRIPGM